jgi:cytoskeleton protein RodZ
MSEAVERTARTAGTLAPAARLGAELRAQRESLGWALPDLAASLRIRQSYLEAIEAGRISELPGTTYALGFVRAYASALGLPGEQVASRFRSESAEAIVKPALSFPAPVPQRGVPAGALMLLGLLILAGAYAGWYYVSEHQRTPAETVPPIPDRLLPSQAEKPTPSPQVASILPSTAPPAPAAPGSAPQPAAPPPPSEAAAVPPPGPRASVTLPPAASTVAPSSAPLPQSAAPQPAAPQPAAPQAPPATAPLPMPSSTAPAGSPETANAPADTRIVVKTTADAWVTVKQPNGPPLLNKLMHAGDSWPVPAGKPELTLTTGNAGGTALMVDGTPAPSLGGSGMVRRDLPLDADMLKSGHLPPARPRLRPAAPAANG